MQVADAPHKWLYQPDEDPKRKHHWNQNEAGFVTVGAIFVGKCPSDMTIELAQTLLNTGIEWSPKMWPEPYLSGYIAYGTASYIEQRQQFRAVRIMDSQNIRRDSLPEIGRYAIRF